MRDDRQAAFGHNFYFCDTSSRKGGAEIVQNSLQSCSDPHQKVSAALICAETEGYIGRHVGIKPFQNSEMPSTR